MRGRRDTLEGLEKGLMIRRTREGGEPTGATMKEGS